MELPGILRQLVSGKGQGFIELCPEEYDMGNLSELIDEALEECEALLGLRESPGEALAVE